MTTSPGDRDVRQLGAGDAALLVLYGYVLDRTDGQRMALIYELEVLARLRRRGRGRQLLRTALQRLKDDRVVAVWLTTGRDNEPARQLYRGTAAEEIDDLLYRWTFPAP